MKIKHWQGYGTVTATKLENIERYPDKLRQVKIKVVGNHEYGLNCGQYDKYKVAQWLGRKSLGNFTEQDIIDYSIQEYSERLPYSKDDQRLVDTDVAIYTIVLRRKNS